MSDLKVLFISGGLGLGHVTRDLAIARALRRRDPAIRVFWLAAEPARTVLRDSGESLLPECDRYANDTHLIEHFARGYRLNLLNPTYVLGFGDRFRVLRRLVRDWRLNVAIFKRVINRTGFDLVVGDESYEIALAVSRSPALKAAPFAMIWDFVGVDATTRNPLEHLAAYAINRWWANLLGRAVPPYDLNLFVGEEEDIPDEPFGHRLPSRRERARHAMEIVGYVCPFDPARYGDRTAVRRGLGYGDEPLVICAIGGTSVGRQLLVLCERASEFARIRIPCLRMVLVCGPELALESLSPSPGVEVRGYVPKLHEHFAACDLAIVQGGGTTTLELTALRRPFLHFPLEQHFEQEIHVARRLARHGAGVRMCYSATTPERLAEAIAANIGTSVQYAPVPVDGATRAAGLLYERLRRARHD
jgi:hypothetical protein